MNGQNPEKSSWFDRVKPHLRTVVISMATATVVTIVLRPRVNVINNITNALDDSISDSWMSDAMKKQLKELGEATIALDDGTLIDLINWAHPKVAKK